MYLFVIFIHLLLNMSTRINSLFLHELLGRPAEPVASGKTHSYTSPFGHLPFLYISCNYTHHAAPKSNRLLQVPPVTLWHLRCLMMPLEVGKLGDIVFLVFRAPELRLINL